MSETSLKYEDYVKRSQDGLNEEIEDAASQQAARQDASTQTNWEERYKELEKLNSRQAQTLGEYRRTIDDFITNPTSSNPDTSSQESKPISWDDLTEDPNSAVLRAVESHPAIREARELRIKAANDERERSMGDFSKKHPDYQAIGSSPEFQNWVVENPTRMDLFNRGNQYDFNAADALFSLFKAERGLNQVHQAQQIQQIELVSSSGELTQDVPKYSRSEYIDKLKRSKQGDLDAEEWVKRNSGKYREALGSGNVRD